MKNIKIFILFALVLTILLGTTVSATANEWKDQYFAYGAGLSEEQLEETKSLIGVPDSEHFKHIMITKEDYKKFTGETTTDSNLFSSAIVIKTRKGSGVNVYINTPENITEIKDHQYVNAALTSGINDCTIIVGSPIKVTGESALVGVYRAFEIAGEKLDEDTTKTASDELIIVNQINQDNKDNPDFNSEDFSLTLSEIKRKIAEIPDKDSITIEEINTIINETLEENNIELSDSDKEKLANWVDQFKNLDINWKEIGKELKKAGGFIFEKAREAYQWGQETGFFARIWEAIKAFFVRLFEMFK